MIEWFYEDGQLRHAKKRLDTPRGVGSGGAAPLGLAGCGTQSVASTAHDSGADLVVGAHPHVIEPYEFYGGKLIVYSLGNFVFDNIYEEVVRRGNILTLTIQKHRLLSWKLVPTHIGDWGDPDC